ncbi:hypothetical protein RMSM_02782 [Rhodopirellula maiorica SM1]|uniref:Uncharacterized protein n=1 Tax=Rhodopirellula maiorica SM1 TaxID=1265738 RepID=M5RLT7_9BACT|nr:hypothetical protein RMSM_02782 [Rhodopirellula maiorica SM1]
MSANRSDFAAIVRLFSRGKPAKRRQDRRAPFQLAIAAEKRKLEASAARQSSQKKLARGSRDGIAMTFQRAQR